MRLVAAVVCAAALVSASANAQTTASPPPVPAGPLTLEQVLNLAEARSESIAIAQEDVKRSVGQELRAKSGLFPQLTASVSYDRALASEFSGLSFGGGDSSGSGGSDGIDTSELPFGRVNTWRLNLNVSQNLYDFGRIKAQRAVAAAGHDSADISLTTTRAQLLFDVTQAYYNAVLSDRMVSIAEATIRQANATLEQTEAGLRAGTQPEFEVLRARVSRDAQNPNLIRQRLNRGVALLRLKQLLDLPADYDLELAEQLGDDVAAPAPVFAQRISSIEAKVNVANVTQVPLDASTVSTPDRTAVKQVASAVTLREAALAAVRAQKMPAVALTSNYGRVAYPENVVAPTFDRTNWTVGVNVSVPVLTGGRQKADEVVAQADLDQTRIQLRQVEELAALDSRSALAELVASRAAWEATAGTVEQAQKAFQLADVRYQAGVSTQLELSDSRLLLQLAEANRAVAARDLQVARARVALLPDLPLGTVTPSGQQQLTAPSAPTPQQTPQGGGTQLQNASFQGGGAQLGGMQ